jgi:hypothetical protein
LKALCLLLALLFLILPGGCGRNPAQTDAPEAIRFDAKLLNDALSIEDIKAPGHDPVEIIRDPATGLPWQINGKFTPRIILTPQDAVLALTDMRDIMNISDFAFACADVDESRVALRVFTLEQLYLGIPVTDGRFRVIATKDGEAAAVSGVFRQDIDVDPIPKIPEKDAEKALSLGKEMRIEAVRLAIFTLPKKPPALCWEYRIASADVLGGKTVYIDAATGEVSADISTAVE